MSLDLEKSNLAQSLSQATIQQQFFFLLVALLLVLVLFPYLEEGQLSNLVFTFLISLVLLAAINGVSHRKDLMIVAICLSIPAVVGGWLSALSENFWLTVGANVAVIVYLTFTVGVILAHILKTHQTAKTTVDLLYGAISSYLMMGIGWSFLYMLVQTVEPGSFFVSPELKIDAILNQGDFIYYSFATLTTLGYGDITPVSSQARSLAILEAVTGTLFIAVLIARLIGQNGSYTPRET